MSIPNGGDLVAQLARDYPDDWRNAHTGNARTEDFIRRLAWVLHSTVDRRFGLLGQRGDPGRIADDCVLWLGEGPGHDPTRGNAAVSAFDVIVGAGGPNPRAGWGFIDQAGPAAWVQPAPVGNGSSEPVPPPITPVPPPIPPTSPIDLGPFVAKLDAVLAEVVRLRSDFAEVVGAASTAAVEAANAAGRASDIKDTLAKGAAIEGDIALSLRGAGLRNVRATYSVTNKG
jgi:hypothetical protein